MNTIAYKPDTNSNKEMMEKTSPDSWKAIIEFDSLDEVQSDEYPILFRHSSDGDFHYLRRGRNGIWYHKRGRTKEIDIMPKRLIFKVWCHRYDGPIVIMAKKWDE